MGRVILFLFLIIQLVSCSRRGGERIEALKLTDEFYLLSLDKVSEAYLKDPSDALLRRKLYLLKQLDWPDGSVITLEEAQARFGLTDEIVHNLAAFYLSREAYVDLGVLLKNWKRYADLDEELFQIEIELLARQNSEDLPNAIILYSSNYKSKSSLAFLKPELLALIDTNVFLTSISSLANVYPSNYLIDHWLIPVLLEKEQFKIARNILQKEIVLTSNSYSLELLAETYMNDNSDSAKLILRQIPSYKAFDNLSILYERENRYDSAIHYLNNLIKMDSSRDLVFRKASLYEKRRWLTSSYYLFNLLFEADSTDLISKQRSAVVANKMAYLRSLKQLETDVPMLDLKPKKHVENE